MTVALGVSFIKIISKMVIMVFETCEICVSFVTVASNVSTGSI